MNVTQDTHKQRTASVKWNSEVAYARRMWNNWIYRIQTELHLAPRTWFVTLTYGPSAFRVLREESFLRWCGVKDLPVVPDTSGPTQAIIFEKLAAYCLRLYLQRLRNAHIRFRYIAVLENGTKNGRIHYHLFIHCGQKVSRRDLDKHWHFGYTKTKLVRDSKTSYYVAKYITKQQGRIKCSSQYGSIITQRLLLTPKYRLMLETTPRLLQKLLQRISKSARYPTRTWINSNMSSALRLLKQCQRKLDTQIMTPTPPLKNNLKREQIKFKSTTHLPSVGTR